MGRANSVKVIVEPLLQLADSTTSHIHVAHCGDQRFTGARRWKVSVLDPETGRAAADPPQDAATTKRYSPRWTDPTPTPSSCLRRDPTGTPAQFIDRRS